MHILNLVSWYPSSAGAERGSFFRQWALAQTKTIEITKVGILAPRQFAIRRLKPWFMELGGKILNDQGLHTLRFSSLTLQSGQIPTPLLNLLPPVTRLSNCAFKREVLSSFGTYVQVQGIPDVVHVQCSVPAGPAAQLIKEHFGVPYIIEEHSSLFARGRMSTAALNYTRASFEHADRLFSTTAYYARALERCLNLQTDSIDVRPNGIDLDLFSGERESNAEFNFLHISALNENKNASLILKSFSVLAQEMPSIRLTIGGDGPERQNLEHEAKALGIEDKVAFLGRLSRYEVRDALAKSDAFLLSSKFETFGIVLIEAMSMGLPLVSTKGGGPDEIVTSDVGVLSSDFSVEAYSDAMRQILNFSKKTSSSKIRQRAIEKYDIASVTAAWVETYKDLIAARASSHAKKR